MKTFIKIKVFTIVFSCFSFFVFAQKGYKDAEKKLNEKAIKEARKEAKKWEKLGFINLPGDPALDKQFEASLLKQFMFDEGGESMYIITMGGAKGGSDGVASANAMDNARSALAGQIQSKVTELVSNNKANTQYTNHDIETIDEFISNSKTLIQEDIGSLRPTIRMYREQGDLIEYRYTLAYSTETVKKVTKRIMQKELSKKLEASDTQSQLDKLLGID